MSEPIELPRWRCHKVVEADKIISIRYGYHPDDPPHDNQGNPSTFVTLACGLDMLLPRPTLARGHPRVGDYVVRYADGYLSWSPAKAFEEGYTRIDQVSGAIVGYGSRPQFDPVNYGTEAMPSQGGQEPRKS